MFDQAAAGIDIFPIFKMRIKAICGIIFLLKIALIPADSRIKDYLSCPEKFENIHRSCFRFVNEKKTWHEAQKFCQNLESELAALEAFQEKTAVNEVIEEKYAHDTQFWFGYQKRPKQRQGSSQEHAWEWLPNHEIVDDRVIPWYRSSYKKKPAKFCGGLQFTRKPPIVTASTLLLYNDRCRQTRFFVCEHKPPKQSNETTTLTTSVFTTAETTTVSTTNPTTITTATTTSFMKSTLATTPVLLDAQKSSDTQISANNKAKNTREMSTIADATIVSGVTVASFPLDSSALSKLKPINVKSGGVVWPLSPSEKDDAGEDDTDIMATTAVTVSTTPHQITTEAEEDDTDEIEDTTTNKDKVTESVGNNGTSPDEGKDMSKTDDGMQQTSERPASPDNEEREEKETTVDDEDDADRTTFTTRMTTPPTTTHKQQPRYRVRTEKPREDWEAEFLPFSGCYIPGVGASLKLMVLSAKDFYEEDRESCPSVMLGGLEWPETEAGETAQVPCTKGTGFANFVCSEEKTCWRGQPVTTDCASSKLKSLLERVKGKSERPDNVTGTVSPTKAPHTAQESVDITSQLVQVTAEEEETTVDDILLTSQVMTSVTEFADDEDTPEEKKEKVEKIVGNVVKAGSNLVSEKKRAVWREMTPEDKVRSASTLMVAMETTTTSMVEKLVEPTVVKEKNEDVELELRVLDIETLEKENQRELVYDSDQSENTFSIPMETLRKYSKGGLAKAVFITHYSMSDILGGRESRRGNRAQAGRSDLHTSGSSSSSGSKGSSNQEDKALGDDNVGSNGDDGPRINSYILSASIGIEGHVTKLPEPVTFTMRHVVEMNEKYIPLCSFWNVSNKLSPGFWSQEGCEVVRTNKTHTKCKCDHLTNFAVLMDVHGIEMTTVHQSVLRTVTIVGCCISCAALLASFLTFLCFTSLQGERNTIHKNLSLCLLLAELLFVCGIDQAQDRVGCAVIAGFLHFLFLAAFTWMFVEGIHIIFMLIQVFEAAKSRLPYYYITGYGIPTVIVGASLVFYHEGYGTEKFCWLTTERYFIWAFAGPVGLILLVNSIFLSYALTTVCRHAEYVFNTKEKTTGSGLRSWVQGALTLEVLLGLTWVFGYFLINDNSTPIAYVFTILNSLQGLFIFIFHCLLSKKTQKEYTQVLRELKIKRSPSMKGATASNSQTRRTSNATNSTNTHHQQQPKRLNKIGNKANQSDKIELNGTNEDHQRLYVGSDGPSKEIQSLPV